MSHNPFSSLTAFVHSIAWSLILHIGSFSIPTSIRQTLGLENLLINVIQNQILIIRQLFRPLSVFCKLRTRVRMVVSVCVRMCLCVCRPRLFACLCAHVHITWTEDGVSVRKADEVEHLVQDDLLHQREDGGHFEGVAETQRAMEVLGDRWSFKNESF